MRLYIVKLCQSMACWIRRLALLPLLLPMPAGAQGAVLLLDIKGAIGPASSDYVHRGLERAREEQAPLVILRLDTPGGLDVAMRDIIHDILGSTQPVVSFVAPGGARAASAGTYILYASHVAVMAPGTNLGAATPVQIGAIPRPGKLPPKVPDLAKDQNKDKDAPQAEDGGDAMQHKMVNDAVAYIRSLAQLRGRNADWAEQAVRTAASLPAEEALKLNIIDLIAVDVPELLNKLDGRQLTLAAGAISHPA